MTEPIPIETLLSELPKDADAWVLQDQKSKLYVVIPHPKYPGRQPMHFFLKRADAEAVLMELVDENDSLKDKDILPIKVKLHQALRSIAKDINPAHADGFVVHSPNEVYEYIEERK